MHCMCCALRSFGTKLGCMGSLHTPPTVHIIGERERANLVVQLARFFGIYPALMYAVMFYVTLNKRKRLGDCVTFSYLSRRCTYCNVSKYALHACHAHHAVKCQGAASYHAFSQRVHAGCQFSPTSSWCGLGSCGSHQLDRSRSPKMHCIHLLVYRITTITVYFYHCSLDCHIIAIGMSTSEVTLYT